MSKHTCRSVVIVRLKIVGNNALHLNLIVIPSLFCKSNIVLASRAKRKCCRQQVGITHIELREKGGVFLFSSTKIMPFCDPSRQCPSVSPPPMSRGAREQLLREG